jgi:sugar phosphate permease
MWKAHLIYFLIYSSVSVLGPILKGELGLNNTEFGVLCGTIGVGTTAAQIPGGIACDRLGVRIIMTLAFVLMAICSFTFSLSESFAFSCFILLFLGIAVGCSQIAAAKAIIDWFPFAGRATAMGIKQTGVNAGGVAGSLALPFLLGLYDWHLLFKSMSILAFLFALFFSFLYRDTQTVGNDPSARQINLRESLHSLKETHFLLLTIAGVFLIVAQFSFSSYLVLYLNQSLHFSLEVSGIILALSFAVGAIARVGWGLISDYLFKSRPPYSLNPDLALISSPYPLWDHLDGLDGSLDDPCRGTITRKINGTGDWPFLLLCQPWDTPWPASFWFSNRFLSLFFPILDLPGLMYGSRQFSPAPQQAQIGLAVPG